MKTAQFYSLNRLLLFLLLCGFSNTVRAQVISALPSTNAVLVTDVLPVVANGGTYKVAVSVLRGTPTVTNSFGIAIDGGGAPITTGVKGYTTIPNAGTITKVTMLADVSGSAVVDIWKCTYAQFDAGATHPVAGDKITASAPPTITTSTKSTDSTLTGWTLTVAKGDVVAFSVTSATTITRLNLTVEMTH